VSRRLAAAGLLTLAAAAFALTRDAQRTASLTSREERLMRSLSLDALPPAQDPSNRYLHDARAAELGKKLFFDERLSANGEVSCSSCHDPDRNFQDGLPRGRGIGLTKRRTMPLLGAAHGTWFFWDGRRDSLWAQALEPLTTPVEHGLTRAEVVEKVLANYGGEYRALFGPPRGPVDARLANVGKAIAAFEATIPLPRTRFDEGRLTAKELEGFRLFTGQAHCIDCHNGPLLTNGEFHNTGVPGKPDRGRAAALAKLRRDPFSCAGPYSDADPEECAVSFLPRGGVRLEGAFKPPSLRGVAENAPYMHNAAFSTLREVLEHYNRAPAAPVGRTELHPLGLTDGQLDALEALLRSLS
jgi:cytochrome c peroxidase